MYKYFWAVCGICCGFVVNFGSAGLKANQYVVVSTADGSTTDGVSFRWAISQSNAHSGQDTIVFNIPGMAPHTISLATALPVIDDDLVILGGTQPANGYVGTAPKVGIDGGNVVGKGLQIVTNSWINPPDSIKVDHLSIQRFSDFGIYQTGTVYDYIISNSRITQCGIGIFSDLSFLRVDSCQIANCDSIGVLASDFSVISHSLIDSCGWSGIESPISNSLDIVIQNTEIRNCNKFGVREGAGFGNLEMDHCYIHHCETGVSLTSFSVFTKVSHCSITDNVHGVFADPPTGQMAEFSSQNSHYSNNQKAIYFPYGVAGFKSKNDHLANNRVGYYIREDYEFRADSCIIGLDSLGMAVAPNDTGIYLGMSGIYAWRRSVTNSIISGNNDYGIVVDSFPGVGQFDSLFINDNFIGTDASGTLDFGNGKDAIKITAPESYFHISIHDNVISGNGGNGITIDRDDISVYNNKIGTDITGTLPIPNDSNGIVVLVDSIEIGALGAGNTIAFNGKNGVEVLGQKNTIRYNSIFCNGEEGVLLVNGGNGNYPPPLILGLDSIGAFGTAPPLALVDLYEKDSCACGQFGQGKTYLATTQADSVGDWSYSGTLPIFITAQAHEPGSPGHSSPFARCCTGPPASDFVALPAGGLTFDFQNTSAFNADSSQVNWTWDFGDGATAFSYSPTHTYAQPGTYQACLIGENACGLDTFCTMVNVLAGLEMEEAFEVKVYPNPTSDRCRIEWEDGGVGEMEIQIWNAHGQRIKATAIAQWVPNGVELDLKDLNSGTYWVELRGNGIESLVPVTKLAGE